MTYPQQPYTQPSPPAPPRKTPTALKVIALSVGGLVIFGIGAAAGSSSGETASGKPAPTVTVTAKADSGEKADAAKEKPAKEKKEESGPATTFDSGSYLVGEEVAAGTYKTSGPSDTDLPNCYWARNKDSSGDLYSVIANGNPEGPTRLTVQEGEIVETSGCGTWTKVG